MGHHGARQLSPVFDHRVVRRERHGGYRLNLSADDREILRQLAPQFSTLLDDPSHPAVRRLFPPAYAAEVDAEREEEYRHYMLEDLVTRHRDELELLAARADAEHLSEEEMLSWSRAINSIRLVLGTVLDVSEDEDVSASPASQEEALYRWLTYLLGEAIDALAGA